jgi:hypothetical protein
LTEGEKRCERCNRIISEGTVCDVEHHADPCTAAELELWKARVKTLQNAVEFWMRELEQREKYAHCSHGERKGKCLVMGCPHHYTCGD